MSAIFGFTLADFGIHDESERACRTAPLSGRASDEGLQPTPVDPLEFLDRSGFKATPRKDGRYDVRNMGVMEPLEVVDLWVRLRCWPAGVGLPLLGNDNLHFVSRRSNS